MKRLAVTRICGILLIGAFSILPVSASGQSYNTNNSGSDLRPLSQLPPIVSSSQAKQKPAAPQPAKSLYLPPEVNSLPPIVSPGQKVNSAPFVYPPAKPNNNSSNQTALPPIVQSSPVQKQQQTPVRSTVPPIYSSPQKSKAGVPFYQSSTPSVGNRPATKPALSTPIVQGSGTRSLPPQGSGTRSLPAVVQPQEAPKLSTPGFESSLAPGDFPTLPPIEIEEPESPIVETTPTTEEGSGTRVPIADTAADSTAPRSAPGTTNYFDLQGSASGLLADSGCSTCGPDGCYNPSMIQAQNGCCGSVANAGYYMFLDAIFWTRADGDVQLSNFFGLNDFNFVGGGRVTLGYRDNATEGREFTYFGTGDLDEQETFTNPAGNLNATLVGDGTIGLPTGFFNSVLHTQTKETQIHSLEYNKVKWGWDLLKSFVGVRYIYFDDAYSFFGTNGGGMNSLFTQDSVNNLFGAQGGFEVFYDVGYRTSASFTSKFGGYINAANVDTNLFSEGMQLLSQDEDDAAIASTVEFNLMSHFQLSPRSRFRIGYDVFLGWGLFTVQNNIPRNTFARGFSTGQAPLGASTGTNLNTNNEPVVFHGPSFGFEVFR